MRDPALIEEFEKRARAALNRAEQPKAHHGRKIVQLQAEVGNLTDAIAGGLLRTSPALAQRLATVESELARLRSQQTIKYPALLVPDLRKRYLDMVASLDAMLTRDPERG